MSFLGGRIRYPLGPGHWSFLDVRLGGIVPAENNLVILSIFGICFIEIFTTFAVHLRIRAMSRICDLTGKKAIVGNKVSFSNKKTKRRFNPNLQNKKFFVPELGEWISLRISTSALRTINKNGISAVLNKAIKKGKI